MSVTRKRAREEEVRALEEERKRKVTEDITCIFDTDDDEMIAAAGSLTSPTPTQMSDLIENVSSPEAGRPPPPKPMLKLPLPPVAGSSKGQNPGDRRPRRLMSISSWLQSRPWQKNSLMSRLRSPASTRRWLSSRPV